MCQRHERQGRSQELLQNRELWQSKAMQDRSSSKHEYEFEN